MTFSRNPPSSGGGKGHRLVGMVLRSVSTRLLDSPALAPSVLSLGVLVLLAAPLMVLTACSPGEQRGTQHADEEARQAPAHRGTSAIPKRAAAAPALEGEATAKSDSHVRWDYVALGDSLAAGVGARRGYVDRYADYLRSDTAARVRVINLGRSGQTSSQLLYMLRNDPSMRKAIGGAEVVTFNIGINDLGQADRSYDNGTCGGLQNERCLCVAVKEVEVNWDAIIEEILSLRSADEIIIRTVGLGYTPQVEGVFEPYISEVNRHIASSAAEGGIPYAEVRLGKEGMSQDGVHPNDEGYEVIADRLRGLRYEPLGPR